MSSTRSPRGDRPAGAGTRTTPVRPAGRADAAAWLTLRQSLWPDGTAEEHAEEIERYFSGASGDPLHVLLADDAAGRPVGLVELSIRPFAEGCRTGRVAYLE